HTLKNSARDCKDDADFAMLFYYYAHKLPFTHYMLYRYNGERSIPGSDNQKHVTLKLKGPGTMYMKINSFSGSAYEMDSAFNVINKGSYENLIIDLRDNPGGSAEAGIAFSGHLISDTTYGGVFLTQKYFRSHHALPSPKDYPSFPRFSEASFNLIIKGIHEQQGLCLQLIPRQPIYKGHLYILTNGNTASTCEPVVYAMKQSKHATIVGERTAGAMLNGETFSMPDGYKLVVPTATFYTTDGYKIDRQGITPDISVPSKDALTTVLKYLNITQ
ncbi:MAG: S41 family peptidase, partial [Flavipsychrobacter sp.]